MSDASVYLMEQPIFAVKARFLFFSEVRGPVFCSSHPPLDLPALISDFAYPENDDLFPSNASRCLPFFLFFFFRSSYFRRDLVRGRAGSNSSYGPCDALRTLPCFLAVLEPITPLPFRSPGAIPLDNAMPSSRGPFGAAVSRCFPFKSFFQNAVDSHSLEWLTCYVVPYLFFFSYFPGTVFLIFCAPSRRLVSMLFSLLAFFVCTTHQMACFPLSFMSQVSPDVPPCKSSSFNKPISRLFRKLLSLGWA